MQTFDQSIFSLFEQKLISNEEAVRWASNVDEFNLKVQGIATTSEMTLDEMARSGQATGGKAPELSRGRTPDVSRGKPAEPSRGRAPEITRFGSS